MSRRGRRALAVAGAIAVCLLTAWPAGGAREPTVSFAFQTYANNVKVVAPLVGPWQLGTARLRGSGKLDGASIQGSIVDFTNPMFSRYQPASLRAQVIGYSWSQGAHNAWTKVTLTVEVTSATNGGPRCEPGVRGVVTLYDSAAKLSNGERSDYVTMGRWTGARCPTFVQGWTNEDGGPRTSPTRGGPPDGGQWAVVRITVT